MDWCLAQSAKRSFLAPYDRYQGQPTIDQQLLIGTLLLGYEMA